VEPAYGDSMGFRLNSNAIYHPLGFFFLLTAETVVQGGQSLTRTRKHSFPHLVALRNPLQWFDVVIHSFMVLHALPLSAFFLFPLSFLAPRWTSLQQNTPLIASPFAYSVPGGRLYLTRLKVFRVIRPTDTSFLCVSIMDYSSSQFFPV